MEGMRNKARSIIKRRNEEDKVEEKKEEGWTKSRGKRRRWNR
jgi:hypothetical protein